MATRRKTDQRARAESVKGQLPTIGTDHHLTGPFEPQTYLHHHFTNNVVTEYPDRPLGSFTSTPPQSPLTRKPQGEEGFWSDVKTLRWVVNPSSSFKIIASVVALYTNWEIITPRVAPGSPNPFASLIFISHRIESSPPDDPRYAKGYLDLVFVASYLVFFSFLRQIFILHIFRHFARWYGIKKTKFDRFGEQAYGIVYWGTMAVWGYFIMEGLPTYWYNSKAFWIGYPHWDMKPQLKLYYLMQGSYWTQQLLVLLLRLEKPRKDYYELVCHHFVTIWLIGWSYLVNMTLIGNAVFLSMDLPDTTLALSKVLNYMQREVAKVFAFAGLIVAWTYFRIYLNVGMLWSVWFEFDLIPPETKQWTPETGAWMVWWMRYQIFAPLFLLQLLNLFWYFLILRIAFRALWTGDPDDDRSDDEDDGESATEKKK